MSEQKRWVLFLVLSLGILLFFSYNQAKQQDEIRRRRRAEAAALAAQQAAEQAARGDGATTASLELAGDGAVVPADAPDGPAAAATATEFAEWKAAAEDNQLVRTKSLLVELGAWGGRIESWKIVDSRYSVRLRDKKIEELPLDDLIAGGEEMITSFPDLGDTVPRRPLELSLVGRDLSFVGLNRSRWSIALTTAADGTVTAVLDSPPVRNIRVRKALTFPPEGFDVRLRLDVINEDTQAIRFAHEERGLGVALGPGVGAFGPFHSYLDVLNALYYDTRIHVQAPELNEKQITGAGELKWVALQNQYFMEALLNEPEAPAFTTARLFIPVEHRPAPGKKLNVKQTVPLRAEAFTEPFLLAPGATQSFETRLFIGPKSRAQLKEVGADVHLPRAVFYSSWDWFRGLCLGMMWMLDLFYGFVGSWGMAIILLTIFVKLVTHPINHKALRATAQFQQQMAKLKPELEKLNKAFKDDPAGKIRAQQNLYKEHGLNPLAPLRGCLPILIQLPIFVALYRIFSDYIVLRGSHFLWIEDLAAPDRLVANLIGGFDLNILPLLMVVTQILSMKLSSKAITDSTQKMMMYIMPVMMLIFFYSLPSGLFLYWTMQNFWQIGHTLLTNKEVEHEEHVKEEQAEAAAHGGPALAAATGAGAAAGRANGNGAAKGQPLRVMDSRGGKKPKKK